MSDAALSDDRGTTLEVRDVGVSYGAPGSAVQALRGVSATFAARQVTWIAGPSGSGKTTLLSVLGCLRRADQGRVSLFGSDIGGATAAERARLRKQRIGFVFQSFRLFSRLTAQENVELPLALLGRPKADRYSRARRILEELGLGKRADLTPGRLSGGEQQRIAIARAIVHSPEVVLADEPTAALDSAAGREIGLWMQKIAHEQGRTVVIVSHDPRLEEFADQRLEMEDGMLREGVVG